VSSRYGRNKRRRHREEMKALLGRYYDAEMKIAKLVVGDWALADGRSMSLTDLVTAVGEFEISERHTARRIERVATVQVFIDDTKFRSLHQLMLERRGVAGTTVEWRGGLWWIEDFSAEHENARFGRRVIRCSTDFEVKLIACPSRTPPTTQYLFNNDTAPIHRPRAVWGERDFQMDPRPIERIAL
jgi:hypothetical protein